MLDREGLGWPPLGTYKVRGSMTAKRMCGHVGKIVVGIIVAV
jgi:hypothetical protein